MLPPLPPSAVNIPQLSSAEVLAGAGKGAQCLEILDRVLVSYPDNARAHALKGRIYAEGLESEKAIVEMKLAVAAVPSYQYGYIVLARCQTQLEHYPQALVLLDLAIKLDGPARGLAYDEKGVVLLKMARFAEARAEIDKALRLHKNQADVFDDLYDRAEADRALKDYAAEVVDLSRRLAINNTNSGDWQKRGDAYLVLGKIEPALLDFQHTIMLAPGDRSALRGLIAIYQKKGDAKKAAEMQKRLSDIDNSY